MENKAGNSMEDKMCLAEGLVIPASFEKLGHNLNVAVIGGTGSGKTVSYTESKLTHTYTSSVVVPLAKIKIKKKFIKLFEDRGYKVVDMDFTNPEKCIVGYDPLDYVHSDSDVIQLARNLIGGNASASRTGEADPYWNESAISVLAAVIMLAIAEAEDMGLRATFGDVIRLYRKLKVDFSKSVVETTLDARFAKLKRIHPENQGPELWKTIQGLAPRTASCLLSIANSAIDKIFSEDVIKITEKKGKVSFRELGCKKVALFITTSPVNKTLQNLVNLFYADLFKELFEAAEKSDEGRLAVPVNVICDDFACGSKINDFEEYISIFRAAGISVTLLLQSESQLSGMYGKTAATTIINNCDTYLYMGGMDIETCQNVALRMNRPLHKVLSMPLGQVVVFRRGEEPYIAKRYQTLNDSVYREIMNLDMVNDDAMAM